MRTALRRCTLAVLCGVLPALAQGQDLYDETHLPEIRLVFAMDDWHDQLVHHYRYETGEYVMADLVLDGVLLPAVGVEHKGDASYKGGLRENMKITLDAFVPGQNYQGLDKITLDAGAQNNVLHEVAAIWGLSPFQVTPRVNLAHLVAGTLSTPYDLGVFTNTERVDRRFVDRHFVGDGHRYWQYRTAAPLEYLGDDVSDYVGAYRAEGGDPLTLFADIAAGSIALEESDRKDLLDTLQPHLDVDAAIRNIVGNRMLGNGDSFERGNNYYLCASVRHRDRLTPVSWDLDLSFTSSHSNPVPVPGDRPDFPLKKLFLHKHAEERAHTYVRHFLSGPFVEGVLAPRLTALMELALPAMEQSSYDPLNSRSKAQSAVDRIVRWVDDTRTRLEADPLYQRQMPRLFELSHAPAAPVEGEVVTATVHVDLTTVDVDEVLLWNRTTGGYQSKKMFDDGAHGDGAAGDGIFGANLPAAAAGEIVQYYVELRPVDRSTHHYAFLPEKTAFAPNEVRIRRAAPGELLLNEFLAKNMKTDYDEFLEAEDWIELYNRSSQRIDLGGLFLSDDPLRPRRWAFAPGTSIAAQGRLRVWADDQEEQGPLHTNFRLAKDAGLLQLRDSDAHGAALLDEIEYGEQRADHSFARVPDGASTWFHLERPTGLLPVVRAGEQNGYDTRPDGSPTGLRLSLGGDARVGKTLRLEVRGGLPDAPAWVLASSATAAIETRLGPLLVDPAGMVVVRVLLDQNGELDLDVDLGPQFADLVLELQVAQTSTSGARVVHVRP